MMTSERSRNRNATVVVVGVAALFAALMLFTPSVARAQGPPDDEPFLGRGPIGPRMAELLELNQEQKDAIHEVMDKHRDDLRRLQKEVMEARRAVREAVHAESFDETAIRDASRELGRAQADLSVARGHMFHEIQQILTPEQREKMQTLHEERKANRDEFRRGRGGPGMGWQGGRGWRGHRGWHGCPCWDNPPCCEEPPCCEDPPCCDDPPCDCDDCPRCCEDPQCKE